MVVWSVDQTASSLQEQFSIWLKIFGVFTSSRKQNKIVSIEDHIRKAFGQHYTVLTEQGVSWEGRKGGRRRERESLSMQSKVLFQLHPFLNQLYDQFLLSRIRKYSMICS